MAKEKAVPVTEDLTGFLIVNDTTGRNVMGFSCKNDGVFLRIITDVLDGAGVVVGKEVKYEYKRGAHIDPVYVDDKIPFGNLVGGE